MSQLPSEEQIETIRLQGKISEVMQLKKMLKRQPNAICSDKPSVSEKHDLKIETGDVIITATDGVYDNLFNREILDILEGYKRERYSLKREFKCGLKGPPCMLSEPEEAQELARRICKAARAKIENGWAKRQVQTPYQRKFKKTYNESWEGGKEDDITVIVTFAVLDQYSAGNNANMWDATNNKMCVTDK